MTPFFHRRLRALLFGLAAWSIACQAQADAAAPAGLVGDIGLGADTVPPIARGQSHALQAIPYANVDYGPLFARIDTFGVKTLPLGYGFLEVVGKFSEDGYTPAAGGLTRRTNSLPLGMGTLQITPVGAVFLNLLRDVERSHGNLADLIYVAEIDAGPLAIYPQAGAEYQSGAYTRYFYGISSNEAGRAGLRAYQPGAATNPFAGVFVEAKLGGSWYLDFNLRRIWLAGTIGASPLVARHTADAGLLAVSYRFQ